MRFTLLPPTRPRWKALAVAALGAVLLLVATGIQVSAQAESTCPAGFPETPAIQQHISQEDILSGRLTFEEIFSAGEALFLAQFNICDGQGRPASTGGGEKRDPDEPDFSRISGPDSNSCAGCHNMPRAGGGGDIVANVFVLAQIADPVITSEDPETSNFRNTLGMFGSGAIEMLAREMTAELLSIRDDAVREAFTTDKAVVRLLTTKGIEFGTITAFPNGLVETTNIEGLDPDLIIKPFHQAGRVISLREFTNNAMNHHHGMQAEERFDLNPEKGVDYDEDGIAHELTVGDITAITIWQAALGVPGQVIPDDPAGQAEVREGERLFREAGCSTCHIPQLRLDSPHFSEPNPYNLTGNLQDTSRTYSFDMTTTGEGPHLEKYGSGAIVRAYTDLKRHNLCDEEIYIYCNEYLSQGRFDQDGEPGSHFFITRKLWDVGNSMPYGHDGKLTTITEAILAHGGEGRMARDAFAALPDRDQAALVRFLKSLQVLPEGSDRIITESQLAAYQSAAEAAPSTAEGETSLEALAAIPPEQQLSGRPEGRLIPTVILTVSVLFVGILIGRRFQPADRPPD